MIPRLVADVGNTRIKWGFCLPDGMRMAALPPGDTDTWQGQLAKWEIDGPSEWAVTGVHPLRRNLLTSWLQANGATVRVISDYRDVPIRLDVIAPEKVGIDRLFNATAAVARVPPGKPVIIIDAGSAVTVDLVDSSGIFRGGSIFPGLGLMARSLHQYTAQLPLIDEFGNTNIPGRDTAAAIRTGVYHAVCGGIDRLVEQMHEPNAAILLAGGNTELAAGLHCHPQVVGPQLTLDGIRRTAWPES